MIQTYQSQKVQQPSSSEEAATKEEVEALKDFVGQRFEEALRDATFEATIRVNCNLRYKPTQNSTGFFRLKAGVSVRIMDTKHKWVRITVIDPADSLPLMGWVLRKHLSSK